jgi:uncharacterized protein (DUF302 family)
MVATYLTRQAWVARALSAAALATLMAVTFAVLDAGSAQTGGGARATVASSKSFDQVASALESQVSKGGMRVVARVNQGRMLSMAGMSLNAALFLIGNPDIGKQLFEQNHAVGLYVPLRVAVYVETDGKTYLQYEKPSASLAQFNNERLSTIAQTLDQKIADIVNNAAR